MSLDLGELVGRIGMDISPLEQALQRGDAAIGQFAARGEAEAKAAGDAIGTGVATGLDKIPVAGQQVSSQLVTALSMAESGARQTGAEVAAGVEAGLQGIPTAARQVANEAVGQLGAGLDGAKAEGEKAGEEAGDGLAEGLSDKAKLAGVAGAAALGAGLLGAMNVEAANDKLSAQLGLSVGESERIGGVAGSLYAGAYGENLEHVNTAVGAVMSSIEGMSNASSGRLEAVTAKALDFATAFEVDVTRAVQVAGQVFSTGLADNANEAFDLLTAASQRVPAALREDLLDAADEYGQFYAGLGYSGEQAFAMLVDASEKGMYGIDKAGDAVKEFTIRSTDMSTASKDAYKAIGLDAGEMANAILAGGDKAQGATQKIIDGILGIKDPSKQAAAAIALFGTPVEDLAVKDIPKFLDSLRGGSDAMDGFKGSTKDMGDTLNDNASTNLESFKRQVIQTFVDVIGGKALPVVSNVASTLATTFGPAVSAATGFLREHEAIVKPIAVALGTFGGLILTVVAAIKVWTAVQTALNVVMAMNPIMLVVVAIAALVAGLIYAYKNSETFRDIVNGAFTAVQAVVGGVLDWLTNAVATVIGFIEDHWKLIVGIIGGPIAAVVLLITTHWDTIKSVTSTVWNAIIDFLKAIPGKIVSFFLNWTLPGLIIKHWDSIKSGTIRVATSIVDWVKGLPGRLVDALSTLRGKLVGVFGDAMSAAWDKTKDLAGNIVEVVRGIPGRLRELGEKFVGAGEWLISRFFAGLKKLGDIGASVGKTLINGVIAGINAGINAVNNAIPDSLGVGPVSINLPDNPFPTIPALATGGRATAATLAVIGEGREPESVLPDSVLSGLLVRARAAGAQDDTIDYERLAAAVAAQSADEEMLEVLRALLSKVDDQPRAILRLIRQGAL